MKEDRITARNVNTLTAAKNAAHMNAKLIGKLELAQRKARPSGIFRHFHIGKMNVSIEQVSFIEGTLVSVYLCLDIARTKIQDKHTFQPDTATLKSP